MDKEPPDEYEKSSFILGLGNEESIDEKEDGLDDSTHDDDPDKMIGKSSDAEDKSDESIDEMEREEKGNDIKNLDELNDDEKDEKK